MKRGKVPEDPNLRFVRYIKPILIDYGVIGCLEWVGGKNRQGYGKFRTGGGGSSTIPAHRFAYEAVYGLLPKDRKIVLDHLCRNPSCVNVNHLELVSQQTNVVRGISYMAMAKAKTHCKRGHEFTLENTYISKTKTRKCRECDNLRRTCQ